MKKILIPTDFSENSYKAIDYITELFKNEVCTFYFLNVYNYQANGLSAIEMLQADDDWFEEPKAYSLQQLEALLTEFAVFKSNPKHKFHVISEGLSLVKAIEKHIDLIKVDLIVLKSHAKASRNIESIVGEIRTCPVLVVPLDATFKTKLKLTIASGFAEEVRTSGIDGFLEIFKNTNMKVSVLVIGSKETVTEHVRENMGLLTSHLERYLNKSLKVEFTEKPSHLTAYAISHLNNIMCVVDNKPDLLRRFGICKSKVISTLHKLQNNTVLTVHQ